EAITVYSRIDTSNDDSDPEPAQDLTESEAELSEDEVPISEVQEWVINGVTWSKEPPCALVRRPSHNILRQCPEPALRAAARCTSPVAHVKNIPPNLSLAVV
ncbi:hypothetical protein Ciccas_013738, partial [Cichlidogyrus casuarinus]